MNTTDKLLLANLRDTWWLMLIRGLAAIIFGVLTWMSPGISLATLVLFFGAYALVDGVVGAWGALQGRKQHDDWWVLLLWALVSVGAGVLTFMAPGVTALALLFYIAAWAIATGVLQIAAAVRLRKQISGEWMLGLAGLSSVVLGILLMAHPGEGALVVVWMIATYAVLFGVLMVVLAFKLRSAAA